MKKRKQIPNCEGVSWDGWSIWHVWEGSDKYTGLWCGNM